MNAHDHTAAAWSTFELAGVLAALEELPRAALDIGCGTGGDAVYLAEQGIATTGLDLSPESLAAARARADRAGVDVTWIEGDALALPLADASVDLVTDRGCLHHIASHDHSRYASEVARVLRPGGTLLVRDMTHGARHAAAAHGHGHAHAITLEELRAMILDAPLRITASMPFAHGEVTGTVTVLRRTD